MFARFVVLGLVGVLGAVAACDSDEIVAPSGDADIRLVNASVTIETFDLSIDGDVIAENIAFGPGECIAVESGTRTITLTANGEDVATLSGNVAAGFEYALVLWDGDDEPAVGTLLSNVQPPGAGVNGLRFINISGGPGDVFLTEPTSDPSGDPAVSGLVNEAVTAFLAAPVAQSLVSLFRVGETTNPIASITLPALVERIGTVVFVGSGAPGGQTALVFEPCPAP